MNTARQELDEVSNSGTRIDELRDRMSRREAMVVKAAKDLHNRRVKAATVLSKAWVKDIRLLGMGRAELELNLRATSEMSASGITRVEALFTANPGEPPKSMGKIASGGELSRIMLALKNIVAGRSEVGVYLFDEVDAGIGGETAQAVGTRLRQLAGDNQVLVVTHLAQIAAKAHSQFRIQKTTTEGRTRTAVEELSVKQRPLEIARMLGDTGSKAAQDLARELLKDVEPGVVSGGKKTRTELRP
jgi:DNA repair protein RecN (Recombination protein N)